MDMFTDDALERANGVVTRQSSMKMRNEVFKLVKKLPVVVTDPHIEGHIHKNSGSRDYSIHVMIVPTKRPSNVGEEEVLIGREVLEQFKPLICSVVGSKVNFIPQKIEEWETRSYPATDCQETIEVDGLKIGSIKLMYGGPYAIAMIFFSKEIG